MVQLFANWEDPDPTPRSVASDLGLHCLPVILLEVSRLQWPNESHYWKWLQNKISSIKPTEPFATQHNDHHFKAIIIR